LIGGQRGQRWSAFFIFVKRQRSDRFPPLEIRAVKLAIKVALVLGQTFIGNPFDPNVTDIR
jgi:hypothetical protein